MCFAIYRQSFICTDRAVAKNAKRAFAKQAARRAAMTCFTRATREGLFRQTVTGWQCQPVFLFLRPWVDPADMFPERRDPAEYEHEQRSGEV